MSKPFMPNFMLIYQTMTLIILAALVYMCSAKNVGTHPIIPFKKGPCLTDSSMMKNFEPEKFFTGTWYERSSYENDLTQADGKCSGMATKFEGNKVEVLFYHYDDFIINRYTSVRGEVNFEDTKQGMFPLEVFFDPTLKQKMPMGVIDTDYENYAIVYSCHKIEAHLSDEMVWTFTRNRGDTSNDGLVERALKLTGFDSNKFTRYGPMTCPAGEPTL